MSKLRRQEASARRRARRIGLLLRKSRLRVHVPSRHNFGGYMLIDGDGGYVVRGSDFDLTLDDVIEVCAEFDARETE